MNNEQIKVSLVSYPDRKFWMMRYVDPVTRRHVARSTKTVNRREAEKIAAKWEAELQDGRYRPDDKVSWEAFRERYESDVAAGLAPKTASMISTVFNAIERILRPTKLHDLTADRLSHFQAKLRAGGRAEPTIRCYLAHLSAALRWAASVDLLVAAPKIQRPKRAKAAKVMKGRPITAEEFERMLDKTEPIVGATAADSWRFYLRGLWWSGLRLGESLDLYWDRPDRLCVELSGKRPMLWIPAALEKGNKDRWLPMAPEFAQLILATHERDRHGRVFRPTGIRIQGTRIDKDWVSRVIARIGRKAGIKVNIDPISGKIKYASAHDLRRSFGERWAHRVMPQVLKELMRHESIETTLKYYVGRNAQMTADALWAAFDNVTAQHSSDAAASKASSTEETSPEPEVG